jgi:flagellar basal-body rod modification protein FlgD
MISNTAVSSLYNNASPSELPQASTGTQDLKDEFLKLLLAQLKNQDPINPVDSTQMLAQQAQFASLEQMQNLNTNLVSLMTMQAVTQATSLIGTTVTGTDASGNAVTGVVDSISFQGGNPFLKVGSSTISPSTVTAVSL